MTNRLHARPLRSTVEDGRATSTLAGIQSGSTCESGIYIITLASYYDYVALMRDGGTDQTIH